MEKEDKIEKENFDQDLTKKEDNNMASCLVNQEEKNEIKLKMTSIRHCGLCYKSINSNEMIVPCSGVGCKGKRVYCSENCREKDWTPKKPDDLTILPAKPGRKLE